MCTLGLWSLITAMPFCNLKSQQGDWLRFWMNRNRASVSLVPALTKALASEMCIPLVEVSAQWWVWLALAHATRPPAHQPMNHPPPVPWGQAVGWTVEGRSGSWQHQHAPGSYPHSCSLPSPQFCASKMADTNGMRPPLAHLTWGQAFIARWIFLEPY